MEQIMKHFDFLVLISKSTPEEAVKVLKTATDEEIASLLNCLSLRTQVKNPPTTKKEVAVIKAVRKRKQIKNFLKNHIKYILPMVAVVLSKSLQDILNCVCDLA